MADMGSKILSGSCLVALAKTAQRLSETPGEFACKTVIVQALPTNEAAVVVGGSDVVAEIGAHEAAIKRKGIALAANESIAIDIGDPANVWVDTIKNKEGVTWLALQA